MKVTVPWTDDKEEFMLHISDGEWVVTTNNELLYLSAYDPEPEFDVKDRFMIFGLAPYHTTDWLRFFCEEHHPKINFDKEFETNGLGVFARYQEKFGHDYEEWVAQEKYNMLKDELAKKGYELPWE